MCNVAFFTQPVYELFTHPDITYTTCVRTGYELFTKCVQNVYKLLFTALRMCFGGQKTTLFTRVHINTQKIHYMTPKTRLESGKHFVNNHCESGKQLFVYRSLKVFSDTFFVNCVISFEKVTL